MEMYSEGTPFPLEPDDGTPFELLQHLREMRRFIELLSHGRVLKRELIYERRLKNQEVRLCVDMEDRGC